MNEIDEFIKSLQKSENQRRQFADYVKTLMLELIYKKEMTAKEMKKLSEYLFKPAFSGLFQTHYLQGGKNITGIYRMLSVLRILDGKHLLDIAKDNYGWTEKNIPDGFGTIDFMLDYRQKIEPKMVINKQKEKNIITSELLKNVEEILFLSKIAHISEGWAETFPPRKDLMDEKSFHDWKELNWKYLWDRWLVIKKIGIVEIDLYDPLSNTNISVSHLCIGQVDGIWIKVKEKE